jgi:hypothetical protein
MTRSRTVAEAQNPEGRTVQMDRTTWNHVLNGHPGMADYLGEVMDAIRMPEYRENDPQVGRQRYFRQGGPEVWLRVVAEFAGNVDRVVTAFPQSNDPRSEREER